MKLLWLTAIKPVNLDLSFLEFKKPEAINLDKLEIRVPYGNEPYYRLTYLGKSTQSDCIKEGIITLLFDAGVVTSSDPDKILKQIKDMPGENGKKLIRSVLEGTTCQEVANTNE
ncbi:MAG: hypothetical protein WC639_04750 [Patescibacteria group bacterium]|jgi:hypothetical protein